MGANMNENKRLQRIRRLLKDLEYECERGWMEGEIEESLTYEHICRVSREIPGGFDVFFMPGTQGLFAG